MAAAACFWLNVPEHIMLIFHSVPINSPKLALERALAKELDESSDVRVRLIVFPGVSFRFQDDFLHFAKDLAGICRLARIISRYTSQINVNFFTS